MQRRIPSGVLSTNPPRCSGHIRNTKYQAGQGLLKGRQNNSITKNVEMSVLRLRFTYVGRYLLFSPLLSLPIQSNPIRTCMNEWMKERTYVCRYGDRKWGSYCVPQQQQHVCTTHRTQPRCDAIWRRWGEFTYIQYVVCSIRGRPLFRWPAEISIFIHSLY